MANQIFVVLPSNSPGPVDNAPNKYTTQLPKTLDLSSGNWVCGLHSISYVYSWHTLGTIESQWIKINFINGAHVKIPVPRMSFESAEQLEKALKLNIVAELDNHFKQREIKSRKRRAIDTDTNPSPIRRAVLTSSRKTEEKVHRLDDARPKVQFPLTNPENTYPSIPEPVPCGLIDPITKQPIPCDKKTKEIPDSEANISQKTPVSEHMLHLEETIPSHDKIARESSTLTHSREQVAPTPSRESSLTSSIEPTHEHSEDFSSDPVAQALTAPRPLTPRDRFYQKVTGVERIKGNEYEAENAYFPSNFSNIEISRYIDSILFSYDEDINKFKLEIDHNHIDNVSFSPQLGYVLGFDNPSLVKNGETAKYSSDLKAGINSFGVYLRGVTENIICGNELVSLLRVVTVSGGKHTHGDTIEKIYDSPIFLKVQPKNINSIEIELRTLGFDGRLLPFQYGNTIITLLFKKSINF